MRRLLALFALICVWPVSAVCEDLSVKGNVFATWTALSVVSPAQDAVVHAGDTVTVTITGQIDINQETRHETHCDVLVFCHDETIPVHHFSDASQVEVLFEIRPVGGGASVANARVGTAALPLQVPISNGVFETQYEIVALLAGVGSTIDPAKSVGSFNVQLDVDARRRASYFSTWLSQTLPSASRATDPAAIADDLRTQSVIVAAALRRYAESTFPVPNAANNDSHAKLVRKAVDIAPSDAENTLALARYFRAVGLDKQADAELANVVARLENLGDPRSRRQLGQAYFIRMTAALSKSGGVDPAATQAALSFADNSAKAFQLAGRPDLVSEVNYARGRLLRGLRTPESLKAAIDAFEAALADAPDTVVAEAVLQTADNRTYAVKMTDALSLSSLVDGSKPQDPILTERRPVAWDALGQRLLVSGKGGLEWLSGRFEEAQMAAPFSSGQVLADYGAIAWVKDNQSVVYVSRDQVRTDLPIAGDNTPICPAGQRSDMYSLSSVTMSLDGSEVATVCNNTLRVFHYSAGTIRQVLEKQIPTDSSQVTVYAVAGPATCGTVLLGKPYGLGISGATLLHGASEFKLVLPSSMTGLPPLATPSIVTFAEDQILMLTATNRISKYRCSDGVSNGEIALPWSTTPAIYDELLLYAERISLERLSKDQLAVVNPRRRSVEVITWPSEELVHYDANVDFSDSDLFDAEEVIVPAPSASQPPRLFVPRRETEVTEHPVRPGASVVKLNIPGNWEPLSSTGDGTFLVMQRHDTPPWFAENKSNSIAAEGTSTETVLDTFQTGSKLIVVRKDAASREITVRIAEANGISSTIPLPSVSAAYYGSVVKELKAVYERWKQQPSDLNVPGHLSPKDIPKIIADPSLLTVRYRADRGSIERSEMNRSWISWVSHTHIGGVLPSLSSAKGLAAITLCALPEASPVIGATSLQLPGELPDQMFIGVEVGSSLGIRLVPPLDFPWPNSRPGALCLYPKLIRGANPTLISTVYDPQQKEKLAMLTPSGWVKSNVGGFVASGWAPADGTLLLLVEQESTSPNPDFSLLRVSNDGSSAIACATCKSMSLFDAFQKLVPDLTTLATASRIRFAEGGAASMVMVDAGGMLLALPDEDETVVLSLNDGRILARVPLGKPLALSDHLLAISSGDERVRFYHY